MNPKDKKAQVEAIREHIGRLNYRIAFLQSQARDADKEGHKDKARRYREVADDAKQERALAVMTIYGDK